MADGGLRVGESSILNFCLSFEGSRERGRELEKGALRPYGVSSLLRDLMSGYIKENQREAKPLLNTPSLEVVYQGKFEGAKPLQNLYLPLRSKYYMESQREAKPLLHNQFPLP